MKVPFLDLVTETDLLRDEIRAAIEACLRGATFVFGPDHAAFEAEFGKFLGGAGVAAVGSGTDALYLALRALGVGQGDEVICPSFTFVATAEAILRTGARPVFADVQRDTLGLDPDAAESAVTPRTKAILPVHLYGMPADMDALLAVARRHGLRVVEDAAQAHGATWNERMVGTLGDLGCFSFYPTKNLGAFGDAGAVVGRDAGLLDEIRVLANHGRRDWHTHVAVGVNSRMDDIQAAVLRVKLRRLAEWNESRRRSARGYLARLADVPGVVLPPPPDSDPARPVYHLFVIESEDRDGLAAHLKARGVATGRHYPVPVHLQPGYADLGYEEGSLPATEWAAGHVLSLPMFPGLSEEQLDVVASAIREFAYR